MKVRITILLLLLSAALFASGGGEAGLKNPSVSGIDEVRLTTIGTLQISQGDTENLEIEADPSDLKRIEIDIQGGRLTIRMTGNRFGFLHGGINYYLTVRDLNSVMTTSSGDVIIDGFSTREIELASASSGDIELDSLTAEFLDVRLSSSGDLTIHDGEVTSQRIRCSSSGDYRAEDLTSATAEVTLTSSGDAYIRADARLTARLSSSGNLYLQGEPVIDALVIRSSGQLRRE